MPERFEEPTPEDAKIDQHPISSFNINAHGENPDFADEDAPNLQPSDTLLAELADRREVSDPETNQTFGLIELNRTDERPPLVSLLQYSIDLKHPDTKYELEQIAVQSGRHVIAFENPSTGTSDKLKLEQREALDEGDFGPIVDGMLGVLRDKGITEADFEGSSLGARLSLAMAARAAEYGIRAHHIIAIETPGLAHMSLAQLVNRFGVKEGANAKTYAKYVQDSKGQASLDSNLDVVKNFLKLIARDARGNLISYPKGLGQATALADMVIALETQPEAILHILSGGASEISRRDDVNNAYQELKQSYGDRIHLVRLAGDTHSFGIGAARRVGWHVSRLLS